MQDLKKLFENWNPESLTYLKSEIESIFSKSEPPPFRKDAVRNFRATQKKDLKFLILVAYAVVLSDSEDIKCPFEASNVPNIEIGRKIAELCSRYTLCPINTLNTVMKTWGRTTTEENKRDQFPLAYNIVENGLYPIRKGTLPNSNNIIKKLPSKELIQYIEFLDLGGYNYASKAVLHGLFTQTSCKSLQPLLEAIFKERESFYTDIKKEPTDIRMHKPYILKHIRDLVKEDNKETVYSIQEIRTELLKAI